MNKMTSIVYVHASFDGDSDIVRTLTAFYSAIQENKPEGMTNLEGVTSVPVLEQLLRQYTETLPEEFRQAATEHAFRGMGMWSEWSDPASIDRFYGSALHQDFLRYAKGTQARVTYRIIQSRDGKVSVRDV